MSESFPQPLFEQRSDRFIEKLDGTGFRCEVLTALVSVIKMRDAQKAYFKARNEQNLVAAKEAERLVDLELREIGLA